MGGRGFRPQPPHKVSGATLVALGALLLLFAMPVFVWLAALGGTLAYLGWSMFHHGNKQRKR
jgi:hypothetical protein